VGNYADKKSRNTGLVYSTDSGRMCPSCRQPLSRCACGARARDITGDGVVRLQLERKGRKGAGVTLVTGVPLTLVELKVLAKELKKKCGVGGSLKGDIIEIQGDQRQLLKTELENRGWKVKLAGG
jgi:translation initiation factor 1